MKENENGFVPFQEEETSDAAPKRNFEKYLESDGQYTPQLGSDTAFEEKAEDQPLDTGFNAFENFQDPPRPVDMMAQMNTGSDPLYYQTPGTGPASIPEGLEEPVSMGEWMVSLLLMLIPCVNIILMFVWAFSKTEKKSKSNFFKAQLIMVGIVFALYLVIILMAVFFGVAAAAF